MVTPGTSNPLSELPGNTSRMKQAGCLEQLLREPPQDIQPRFSRLDDIVRSGRLDGQRSSQQLRGIEEKSDSPRWYIAFRRGNRARVLHRCDLHFDSRRLLQRCGWQGRIRSDLLRLSYKSFDFKLLSHVRSAVALVFSTSPTTPHVGDSYVHREIAAIEDPEIPRWPASIAQRCCTREGGADQSSQWPLAVREWPDSDTIELT